LDRFSKSKRREFAVHDLSGIWMIITVIVLVFAEVAFLVNLMNRGEGGVALAAMGFFWPLSIALIPCMFMVAKLNSPLSTTMLGAVWNPFNGIIVGLWVVCNIIFVIMLSPKPNRGGKEPE
jgi:hypothetical protein